MRYGACTAYSFEPQSPNRMNVGQLLRPRQEKKGLLSEASLNRRVNATATRSVRSRKTRSTKSLVLKSQINHQRSPKLKSSIQPTFAGSEAGFARFLKEHTSPKHQRVTAGGRIVPMEPIRKTVSSDEHIPAQKQDFPPSALNGSTEDGVQHPALTDVPSATHFDSHENLGGFAMAYHPPFVPSVAAAPQVFDHPEPSGWISSVYPHLVPNAMAESFLLCETPSVPSVHQMAPESRSLISAEQWSTYHSGHFEMPNGAQSNIDRENWNIDVSMGMENWSLQPFILTMENAIAVIPGLSGDMGINNAEFSALFEMLCSPSVEFTLEFVNGILDAIVMNVIDEERWLTARSSLEGLIRLSEERLQVVNMVAASDPHTRNDLVRQRCYYINLRVMFSDVHDRLANEWNVQHHDAPCALGNLNLETPSANVAGGGPAWVGDEC